MNFSAYRKLIAIAIGQLPNKPPGPMHYQWHGHCAWATLCVSVHDPHVQHVDKIALQLDILNQFMMACYTDSRSSSSSSYYDEKNSIVSSKEKRMLTESCEQTIHKLWKQ